MRASTTAAALEKAPTRARIARPSNPSLMSQKRRKRPFCSPSPSYTSLAAADTLEVSRGKESRRGSSTRAPREIPRVPAGTHVLSSRSDSLQLLAVLPLVLLAGCKDDITCVFTTGCRGGGQGFLGESAALPEHGSVLLDMPPAIVGSLPSGIDVATTSPVVIAFSESMDPASLDGAIEIVLQIGQVPGPPVADVDAVLFGDGQLLGLFPAQDLAPGLYRLRFSPALVDPPRDLTGQALVAVAGALIGQPFTVGGTVTNEPQVLAEWPIDGTRGASDLSEIAVVFDRPMDPDTIDADSFEVLVEGAPPATDPAPEPLVRASANGPAADTRVFRYRSADAFGTPVSLGASADVEVELSPAGDAILDADGDALPTFTCGFQTSSLQAPVGAARRPQPSDAIGLAKLTPGDPEELTLQVELAAGEPGDQLDLYLFGDDPDADPPVLAALRRTLTLQGPAPITTATFTLDEIDLLASTVPGDARFADGLVAIALRLRRGAVATSLRVVDVDPGTALIQDPVLDTVAPTILSLLPGGSSTSSSISSSRDIALAGTADEPLRSVEVTTGAGTNGVLPPAAARDDGRFLAAAVPAGPLAGASTSYTAVGYDAALNPSPPITGTHEQRGGVGPGAFAPGDALEIEVFDARTLAPVAGAAVFVHADLGDGVNFPLASSGATGLDGKVVLASMGAPAVGALVTAELAGYDLATFFGVTSARVSLPLEPTASSAADVTGAATTSDPDTGETLRDLGRRVDDSRRAPELARTFPTDPCTSSMGVETCEFGPEPVAAGPSGVQTFLAGDLLLDELTFLPELLVRAFVLLAPVGPTDGGDTEDTTLVVSFLLDDPAASTGSGASELAPVVLRGDATIGIDLLDLDDDPATTGEPFVSVEAAVPGLEGPVTVGLGLAFEQFVGIWNVRSAIPGAVDAGGIYGASGAIDPDLFLHCELRDGSGAVAGARPRLSSIAGLGGVLFASDVPALLAPAPGGATGAEGFSIAFSDVVPDAAGMAGLYRVELADTAGRRWTLWRTDPAGSASTLVHAPDVVAVGGDGLADGALTCRIHAFAWPELDVASFFWTDAERLCQRVSRSSTSTFQKP
jgi:hypothetical protein